MEKAEPHSNDKYHIRLFSFTQHEEACIRRAIEESKLFMESYGKGQRPYAYIVNPKHYH